MGGDECQLNDALSSIDRLFPWSGRGDWWDRVKRRFIILLMEEFEKIPRVPNISIRDSVIHRSPFGLAGRR